MIYYLLIISGIILSQFPNDYELTNRLIRQEMATDSMFTSNGIMDIRGLNDEILFLGTNNGLNFIDISLNDNFQYGHPLSSEFPMGGNPALFIHGDKIVFSGVVGMMMQTGYESKGTGLSYSINGGDSWTYLSQPIDSIPEIDMDGFQIIPWGGQNLYSLSVTTDINNVSYDIAMDDKYIYAANWAGGIRRFNHLPASGQIKEWEIIPLPQDGDRALLCGEIDSTYSINPKDPGDGGNHNHKGFSVHIIEDTLWVGTAAGINKGIIGNDDCIDWVRHYQSGLDNISGNWVIGFAYQPLNGFNRLWAITWATEYPEKNALSYTEDGGLTWHTSNPLGNMSGKVYNLNIEGNQIWASTEKGLYLSNDGKYWEKYDQFKDMFTGEKILTESVYSSYYSQNSQTLFVGTGDGMVMIDDSTKIKRFWESPDPFSVYPNPFFINDFNQINDNGHVRFIFLNPNQQNGKIDIYDFSMDKVTHLTDSFFVGPEGKESEIIWNGKNQHGDKIANGVYFCRLSLSGKYYWTKLAVIN